MTATIEAGVMMEYVFVTLDTQVKIVTLEHVSMIAINEASVKMGNVSATLDIPV